MNHSATNRLRINGPLSTFRRVSGVIVLAATLSMAAGCTAMKPLAVDGVDDSATLAEQLSVGQKVIVDTVDGERFKFTVTQVDDSGIGGENHFIAYGDIDELRTKKLSATNTAGMVLAVNVALAAAAVAIGVPAVY